MHNGLTCGQYDELRAAANTAEALSLKLIRWCPHTRCSGLLQLQLSY